MNENLSDMFQVLVAKQLAIIEAEVEKLEADRDYWKGLAMQFHDAVHAAAERRKGIEI
jgi:hypothetical protein